MGTGGISAESLLLLLHPTQKAAQGHCLVVSRESYLDTYKLCCNICSQVQNIDLGLSYLLVASKSKCDQPFVPGSPAFYFFIFLEKMSQNITHTVLLPRFIQSETTALKF